MARKYDFTIKELLERFTEDWVALTGLPRGRRIKVVDADISGFSLAADKVIFVGGPRPYILHIEFQTGPDATLHLRLLAYNALLRLRHKLPVRTVVILLRKEAQLSSLNGRFQDFSEPQFPLDFGYRVIRAWQLSPRQVLQGGLGTLALAPLSAVKQEDLPDLLGAVRQRLARTADTQEKRSVLAATYVLAGLRFSPEVVNHLFEGVLEMEESSTYQFILQKGAKQGLQKGRKLGLERGLKQGHEDGLKEGQAEGRSAEARSAIVLAGRGRLGKPPATLTASLQKIKSLRKLEGLIERTGVIASWDDLLSDSDS